jgi:hypothetical protein
MSYGAVDNAISASTPALHNLDSGDESDLTPLSSDDEESDLTPLSSEDEDENGHPTLNASKLKLSIAAL